MELEQFFTPTWHLQDLWEDEDREDDDDDDPFEVELAVPVEEFLNYHWEWKDLWAFASANVLLKVLWLTDGTFIAVGNAPNHFDGDMKYCTLLIASSTTTSGQVQTLALIEETDGDVLRVSTEACNVFWRAIETNKSAKIKIQGPSRLPSGPSLQYCNSCGDDRRSKALNSGSSLRKNTGDSFTEWFRRNQVVVELTIAR
jgi:hypothetical protein